MNCFIPTSRSGKANGQNVIIFRNVCFTTIKFKLSLWKCRRTPEKPVMNRQTWHGWYKIFTIVYSLKYAVQKNKHYFTRYCSITVPKQKTLPPNQISTHPITSAGKAFLFCAFAGILEILRRKKSALWAGCFTCLSGACSGASLTRRLMLLADFFRLRIS